MRINRLCLFGLILAGLTVYSACRKIDLQSQKIKLKSEYDVKFFNNHGSTDPHVLSLIAFLKRQNAKNPFVEETIERVGYPLWDKAQFTKVPAATGRGTSDSLLFTYIPFSRDTIDIVNATLIFRTSEIDTATKWICDWQYHDLPNSTFGNSGSAEEMALFFMQLQSTTFGDSMFVLTDSTLFVNTAWPTWESGSRKARLKSNQAGGRSGKLQNQVWECMDIYYCGAPSDWWACFDYNGCDYDEGCPGTGSERCFLVEANCTCLFGCGGNSGNPFGGGEEGWNQGGGGASGGGPPPNCTPTAVRSNSVNQNCLPGWAPNPGPPTPCDKIYPLKNDPLYRTNFADLKNKTSQNREFGYYANNSGIYTYVEPPVNVMEKVEFVNYDPVWTIMHSHYAGGLPIFSVGDFEQIAKLYYGDKININTFVAGVATETGSYVLTIENQTAFNIFLDRYIDFTNKSARFELEYDGYQIGTANNNEENIKNFLKLLSDFNVGVAVLKANVDFTAFSKLSLSNNTILYTPCN